MALLAVDDLHFSVLMVSGMVNSPEMSFGKQEK
ncbi:MAG: hypothetical protein ACI9LM_003193 [Alteromonadaceae bacterium]|jgi:hypothetical protein